MFQSCASKVTTFVTHTRSKINIHPKEPTQDFFPPPMCKATAVQSEF